ncbi:MAG: hypothetical protein R6W78_16770 [Bacteroidales bacterium]
MKTLKLNSMVKNILSGALILLMLSSFTACSKKMVFQTSSIVPAANGYVNVKSDKNKNYVIKVSISNLAEISRLQPDKQTYVVWILTEMDQNINVGQLKSSSGMFSKRLTADFETVSSYKPAKVFITAETDGSVEYPGNMTVLTTGTF